MAISVTPQSGLLPLTARRCAGVAGWLSVAYVVLLTTVPCQAQGLQHIQTVLDGGRYRWDYVYVPTVTLPTNGTITISGLYDVQAAASQGFWAVTVAGDTVNYRWTGADLTVPQTVPPALSYTSSSNNPLPKTWIGSNGETGTVAGAAPMTASVSVYDNWIGFGALNPTQGTSASPAKVIASKSPASSWAPTTGLGVDAYDVGYVQINATRRLNVSVRMNGHLKRCTPTGQAFAGVDTRKQTPGPYELATQWKIGFGGRFLTPLPAAAAYSSPTSGQVTDYNLRTGWSTGGNDPISDSGWLWPSATDAWTGQAVGMAYAPLSQLDLVVERDQYTGGTYGPASIAIIERVLRRGQQDVEGNYKQVIDVTLTYAE